jgi:iron complex transport system substrate-binding protein
MKLKWASMIFSLFLCQGLQAKSCLSFFEADSKSYNNQFAKHFKIKEKSNLTLVQSSDETYRVIYKKKDDLPDECLDKAISKLDSVIPTSTSMLHFFDLLEKEEVIKGFPGTRYISSVSLKQRVESGAIKELGDSYSLETLILMDPGLILTQGAYSISATGLERYQAIKDKNFSFLEFKESHPLARAEWLIVLSALLGEIDRGIVLFEKIKSDYLEVRSIVENSGISIKVLVGSFFQGQWFSPAPNSDFIRLLEDAGATLVNPISRVGLNFENVLLTVESAKLWLPQASWQTREEALSMDERHLILLGEFGHSEIFALKKKSQGLEFWERGVARPDLVLKDLVQMFGHRPKTQLHFYTSLASKRKPSAP